MSNLTKEMEIIKILGRFWSELYNARESLGKDHPEYEKLHGLLKNIDEVVKHVSEYERLTEQ